MNRIAYSFPRSAYSTCRPPPSVCSPLTLPSGLKVLCSYEVNAICKVALLRYLSEFRFQVLTAIASNLTYIYP